MHRPTHVYVTIGLSGTEILAERTVYGEGATRDKSHNLRGQVYRQYDDAGVVTNADRDFKGNLTQSQRQLAVDYTPTFNWNAIASATTISAIETVAAASLESPRAARGAPLARRACVYGARQGHARHRGGDERAAGLPPVALRPTADCANKVRVYLRKTAVL